MLPLRREIDDYSRACERLIVAAGSLVDRLVQAPRPQGKHDRQTMRDYAQTSEALLRMKNLSNGERDSIRDSVADVTEKILDADQGQ